MLNRAFLAALAFLALALPVAAQNEFPTPIPGQAVVGIQLLCQNTASPPQSVPCGPAAPLSITGNFSALLTPFAPGGAYANLTATGSSANVALPTNTGSVVAYNIGTTAVSCKLSVGSGTAVANEDIIQPGMAVNYSVGSNTYLNCIDQTGSASNVVVVSGGSGLFAGAGGGGSGAGGGAVTQGTVPWVDDITQWANVALGAPSIFGTSPGGVQVPGVNAAVTQSVLPTNAAQETGGNLAATATVAGTTADSAWAGTGNATLDAALKGIYNVANSPILGAVTTAAPTYTPGTNGSASLNPSGGLRVDGSGVTQPVSSSTLATAANQPTNAAQGSTTAAQTGHLVEGAVTTAAPTYTTAQTNPLSMTTAGALRGDLSSSAGTALGAPTAFGTSPSGNVLGTNSDVTACAICVVAAPAAIANSLPVVPSSQYPANATAAAVPVTATATGTTAATVATLAAVSGKTTFICGFTITADATALAVGTASVAGGTMALNYLQGISAVTSGAGNLTQSFNPCIPASAANTAITVTSAAAGAGGNTIVNAQGYVL
jgi:hypothetical protein